ncbi:EscR/YscR/HrcR family type III secretion system export apparatus protein [Candidatus Aerophobetes bacterium]|uniref:EscR/YscR/HrcR family type III secretion system export apparatus protein n=1 Tax=Aerophobetes bacterium TaxID=2030807 RepID=A0A2A4YLF7_UNCAE|nr:MAG: EscR/YscR/HrcR family type III secretion system export apparatus protein [Candidatus Aerophobetes bacterium]
MKRLYNLKFLFLVFCSAALCFSTHKAYAQSELSPTEQVLQKANVLNSDSDSTDGTPNIITKVAVLAALALLPFVIMLLTSFLKMVVVMSLLRNALGVQQSPPNQAINGIALLMTIYVMFPTCLAMYNSAQKYIEEEAPENLFSGQAAYFIVNVMDKSKEPLKEFLQRNSMTKHQRYFYQLAYKSFPGEYRKNLKMNDLIVLVPTYVTSQLKSAFEIGVLIYLPFFVIDLVTSNILLAMGMMMLSPLTIALPLKLLLIVMVDGWTLVIQGLVLTYR